MSGGSKTISTSETKAEALNLQSSAYGVTIPVVHGTARLAGNLLDYQDFKAIAHTTEQSSGGKGGDGPTFENTTYTYTVSIVMLLCEGPVYGVPVVLVGKKRYTDYTYLNALSQVGADYLAGAIAQPIWSPLLTMSGGSHAVGYSGLACAVAQDYQLGSSAQIENHNFVVIGPGRFTLKASTGEQSVDADPRVVMTDWLTNPRYGVGFDAGWVGDLSTYAAYCKAAGLVVSIALTEQAATSSQLQTLGDLTNSVPVLMDSAIHMVPMGDEALSYQYLLSDGASLSDVFTYTPDLTPIYDLTPDSFLAEMNESPIRITRKSPADAYNSVKVEYLDAAQDYNVAVAVARDQASIDQYGLREAPTLTAHWLTNSRSANLLAQIAVRRFRYVLNTYEFSLPWNFARLVPTNLVTLTDPAEGMDRVPVRIETIEEDANGFKITAKDFPHSVSGWSSYTPQGVGGFKHDYNAAPGNVHAPVFIEPPVELATSTGLEVWVAVTGDGNPNWGGCEVWASYDGLTYKQLGTIFGGARYGTLSVGMAAGSGGTASVSLVGNGGQMLSGSAADLESLATLCWVRGTGPTDQPEFFAYQTATLTGTNAYDLTTLSRGAYDSKTAAKGVGATFVRVDSAIMKGMPLQPSDIGKTLQFKFLSFNYHGGGLQDIASVVAYPYTVRGDMALLPPPNVTSFLVSTQADGTRQFTWDWGATTRPSDLKGYILRYRQGTGPFAWESMLPFQTDDGFQTASPVESNLLLAGSYVFAIKTVDTFGVEAENAVFIDATLPDPRLGSAIEFIDEYANNWPGTKTDCVTEVWEGDLILRAVDATTWATAPSTWAAFTRWVWDPVTSFQYEAAPVDFGLSVAVLPVANYTATGDVTFEIATSSDGTTWSSYAAVAGPVVSRYVKARITVAIPSGSSTGPGVTPVCTLSRLSITYVGKITSETSNDVNTSTFTGVHRIGTGDVRLPVQKTWVHISRVTVTLQSVGAGWSWVLLDKDGTDGPHIKIYNGSGALADALIDWTVEGIAQ